MSSGGRLLTTSHPIKSRVVARDRLRVAPKERNGQYFVTSNFSSLDTLTKQSELCCHVFNIKYHQCLKHSGCQNALELRFELESKLQPILVL